MKEQLLSLKMRCPVIRNICCKGLAASVELTDKESFERIMPMLAEEGLLVSPGANNKIVLRPPYVITEENIDHMIRIFEKVFA